MGPRSNDLTAMSVTEVAERAEASEGSVISLCRQLGARGFQQVKIALARDLVQPVQFIHEDLARTDDTGTVIEKVFRSDPHRGDDEPHRPARHHRRPDRLPVAGRL